MPRPMTRFPLLPLLLLFPLLLEALPPLPPLAPRAPLLELPFPLLALIPPLLRFGMSILG